MHPLQKLVAVPLVRRFSYLPCARLPDHHSAGGEIHSPHAGLPPGWWRYSLTNPMMDFLNAVPPLGRFSYLPHARFSRHHSVGGEILLLALCWTLSSSFSAWWGGSIPHPVPVSLVVRRVPVRGQILTLDV